MAAKKKKKSAPEKPDAWEQLSSKKQHAACLGFLFILPFILFFASTLGGQQYMGHDVIQWRAGAESLIEHRETYDEVAHWAANMFSGMPATTISHPPQIWNIDMMINRGLGFIYPAVEFWVLFGGAYLMFLLLGFKPLTAVFGSLVIGFSTYIPIIIGAGHNAKFLAYIYIPWIYVGYLLMTRSKINRWLAFFAFGLALTLHLRAYHPQVTYFFLFPLGTLFIYDFVQAWKAERIKPFLTHTGWLSGAAVIALLITVQLYWSTAEYSQYSMRGGSEVAETTALSQDYAFAWSQGIGELLTLAIPNSYGGSSTDAYWGPKSFTSGPHYMGALVVLFFIIGVIKSRHKLKWVFLGPGIATMLFSLGENFMLLNNTMFSFFPLFDKFRVPEMWLMIAVFCFAVVSVMGLGWITDQFNQHRKKQTDSWKRAVYISGAAGALIVLIGFSALSFEKQGERQQFAQQFAQQNQIPADDPSVARSVNNYINNQLIPERQEMARGDTLRFGFFFIAGLGLIWFAGNRKISPSVAVGSFCILLAFDLIQVDNRYLSEGSLVDGSVDREQVIERQERELDRVIRNNVYQTEGWSYRTLPLLDSPFNNAVPAYFYPSVGGYSGAKLGYYQDLIDEAIFSGPAGINIGVLNMLNVKYLTAQGQVQIPGFETIHTDQQGSVIENQTVLPKAWFVDRVEVLNSQPDVLRRISEDFDAGLVAFVTEEPGLQAEADPGSTVSITQYNANRITMEISRSAPGFLVLGEIWYPPGWTATLNDEEIDIVRTNYVLRGFEIPAGEHELEMVLDPVWYSAGNWLARIGTVALFGTGLFGAVIFYRREEGGKKIHSRFFGLLPPI